LFGVNSDKKKIKKKISCYLTFLATFFFILRYTQVPPVGVDTPCEIKVKITHDPLYIAGLFTVNVSKEKKLRVAI